MKFNRVNDNKLQIIISQEDLEERNIKKWDFLPQNPNAQKIFREILEEAYESCGFDIEHDTQLMIEAYPMTGESMIVNVTKVGKSKEKTPMEIIDDLGIFTNDLLNQELDDEVYSQNGEWICLLSSFEDAIALAKVIQPGYDASSRLYQYKDGYYLVLDNTEALDPYYEGYLFEYGDVLHLSSAFLSEHGQCLMQEEALKILANF